MLNKEWIRNPNQTISFEICKAEKGWEIREVSTAHSGCWEYETLKEAEDELKELKILCCIKC